MKAAYFLHACEPAKLLSLYVFDCTKMREITLLLSAVNPINESKTVLVESLSPRKPDTHVNTR